MEQLLIIVGATEFIAAVHLLYNVLSFYTCQTGQFFEFNEIIYYKWVCCKMFRTLLECILAQKNRLGSRA